MSANNQTLIKKHKGKWLIFENIPAESWDNVNTIRAIEAVVVFRGDIEMVRKIANLIDETSGMFDRGTEYGVSEQLVKDGAEVKIIK